MEIVEQSAFFVKGQIFFHNQQDLVGCGDKGQERTEVCYSIPHLSFGLPSGLLATHALTPQCRVIFAKGKKILLPLQWWSIEILR